jgi:hypothetical protein
VRDRALHSILEAFTAEAAGQLAAETAHGAEIQFELAEVERRAGRVPLYCYRPLTEGFIDERFGLLSALPTYTAAARALTVIERIGAYLITRGERRFPPEPRARAELALRVFLRSVFAERSDFGFDPARFEVAYAELEDTLYAGQSLTTVIAPLLGVALDEGTEELPLGDGLSLIQGDAVDGAPPDAAWGERGEPRVLAMLAVAHDPGHQPPLSLARMCFRRLLTALRLFEHGGYALGPLAWMRVGDGPWQAVPLGTNGRLGLPVLIGAHQEDELRAFCSLLSRRLPTAGEVAWALSRFEMGAERLGPFEALSDYLLALRALLDPEGVNARTLPERLAAICVPPEQRTEVASRTARAIALEREVITGGAPSEPGADAVVDELCAHLRALLRDIICGHLGTDLVGLADGLLAAPPPAADQPTDPALKPVPVSAQ